MYKPSIYSRSKSEHAFYIVSMEISAQTSSVLNDNNRLLNGNLIYFNSFLQNNLPIFSFIFGMPEFLAFEVMYCVFI